jgi:1-acyl-sn-glycerol-3-phosphate acyltransferase
MRSPRSRALSKRTSVYIADDLCDGRMEPGGQVLYDPSMIPPRMTSLSLAAVGWRFDGQPPPEDRYVCLAVPHTSNWDGLLLVAMAHSIGLDMRWMIKDTWFRGPMGPLLRRLGAIAIDRDRARNVVSQMVDEFSRRDRFILVIPPEGTRRRAEYWKSGFYHIARQADVPVVPGYLDYGRKRCGLGSPIHLTGDVPADMDRIRAFYQAGAYTGRIPASMGPIRLREEEAAAAVTQPRRL